MLFFYFPQVVFRREFDHKTSIMQSIQRELNTYQKSNLEEA